MIVLPILWKIHCLHGVRLPTSPTLIQNLDKKDKGEYLHKYFSLLEKVLLQYFKKAKLNNLVDKDCQSRAREAPIQAQGHLSD